MAEEIVTWIDPTGVETVLGVEWDVDGRFSPDVEFIADKTPGRAGQVVREVRHDIRPVTMPLWIGPYADDIELRTALRDLVYRLDPVRGVGRLRVQSPLADVRELPAYARLSMPERLGDTSGQTVQRATVTFTAYCPYWEASSDVVQVVNRGDSVSFFPFPPLRLTSSEVFQDIVATNDGDVETWPVWTVNGPGDDPVFRNLSTGKTLSLTGLSLAEGESVSIDTRPGVKTVTKDDGSNLFSLVGVGSSLFPLATGDNSIRIEMSAAVVDSSSVVLSYRPKYLAP